MSDFQKLLRYSSGIEASVFKSGTGGHGGWSSSEGTGDCGGLNYVFLLFLSYT